jgi:excisionase family DNA binding protein
MRTERQAAGGGPDLLTTREVADLLRIKERKVYDLVASAEIPHVRVTGKLLFPRALIEGWLLRHSEYRLGAESLQAPPSIVAGSHDPLLEWALREAGTGLATFFDGSLDGLERLRRSEAMAAGLHLREDPGDGWNLAHVQRALDGQPVVLVEWARREQGLIVPPGNPHGIHGPGDLVSRRVIPRQRGAGSFLLLQHALAVAGVAADALQLLDPPARSEADVALAIADGKADAGLGLAAMARQFRLDFVPVARERYDLVLRRRAWFEPPFQRLLAFCRSERFLARAEELGGYEVSGLGTVHYNGP